MPQLAGRPFPPGFQAGEFGTDGGRQEARQLVDPDADIAELLLAVGLNRQQRADFPFSAGAQLGIADFQHHRSILAVSPDDVRHIMEGESDIDGGAERCQRAFDQTRPPGLVIGRVFVGNAWRLVAKCPPQIFQDGRFSGAAAADQGRILSVELEVDRAEEGAVADLNA